VSHQIRTPLNIIMGFAQVLRDSLVSGNASMALPENETATITGMMKHNAAHLNRMVQMLFDSSESGITEELQTHRNDLVSCNEVARECIAHTNGHFPEIDIKFETDLTDDVYIRTSHLYLMRTLRELLYNAAKYSDGKHLSIRITRTDNMIRFTVEDVGPGMSEAAQEVMFNPFTKVDDLTEGLGLGLPLAKRHARSLGGDLLFDSNYHDGCRFIVEMPINLEPTE
jgi:signal transduction histidine kinase